MLSKPAFGSIRYTHISLAFIGLMWTLPFLYYRHVLPLTTFYQEWGAAMLGLCATLLLLTKRYWQQPEIPRIVLLPIALMLLIVLQFALGKVAYFSHTLLTSLYLMWAALLIMLGHRLREELGLPVLATVLAVFLLLGAELNALAGVLQNYRLHTVFDTVVAIKIPGGVYGNVAQPNHYANYIMLGLISLGLLRLHLRLNIWLVVLLAAPLLFVMVLSGSRSSWLYLLFMAAMSFLWQRRDKSYLPLLRYSLLLILGFSLMHVVVMIPWLAGPADTMSTVERLTSQVGGRSIRLHLWHEAWLIFTQHPWLGAGVGQFGWQHFMLGPSLRNTIIQGIYNNAHNTVMQIAAEMGMAGLLILFGTLALWMRQAWSAPRTIHHWWGYGLLAVLGIHSMVEYPLWYAYFIGVAALTLGMLDNTTYRLELRGLGRLSVAAILLLGVLSLMQVWQGYRKLEGMRSLRPTSAVDENFFRAVNEGLVATHKQALLQPYSELVMSNMIDVNADHLEAKRELNSSVVRFLPAGPVAYREAFLMALSGDQAAAQLQIERSIWAFPAEFPTEREKLRALAQKDPVHFAALLEFALKKYEEYQLAVRTR